MNLLADSWIPVSNQGRFEHISYRVLLCSESDWRISLPRDDMEMACLELLISLTQVLFMPNDINALKHRICTPLPEDAFLAAVEEKAAWFDLDHPRHPFMQLRGVKAKQLTGMEKLFAGLTGATSSVFVNEPGLASRLCPGCAAIGLFNQANNCPGFGGGFKAGLRGSTPITTLVQGNDLRKTVWFNVLPHPVIASLMPWYPADGNNKPNWVDATTAGEKVVAHRLGLLRGLFWQPAHIELINSAEQGTCHCCGGVNQKLYIGFNKEKFVYSVTGTWPHPHSPHAWKLNKGEKQEQFPSFTTTAPAWTLLSQFVIERQAEKQGHSPAPVVMQARTLRRNRPLFLLVGGYRNKQASILERRHELFSIAREWQDHPRRIERIVETGLAYKGELRKKLFGFYKATGAALYEGAEERFFSETEGLVHDLLREMNFKESRKAFVEYHTRLTSATRTIFDQVTRPYRQTPKMIRALAVARRGLEKAMKDLREE